MRNLSCPALLFVSKDYSLIDLRPENCSNVNVRLGDLWGTFYWERSLSIQGHRRQFIAVITLNFF